MLAGDPLPWVVFSNKTFFFAKEIQFEPVFNAELDFGVEIYISSIYFSTNS